MKTLGIILAVVITVGGLIGYVVSAKFTAERFEQSIIANDENMQNTWAQMQQSLEMQGFTVKNYGETFINSIKANASRYENDKNAMMKFVQEAQSQMSPDMHKKFMDTIEKTYAKKEAVQKQKISVSQEYRTYLNASIKGTVSSVVFSYPTQKATTIMDRIISTQETKNAWAAGVETTSNPFGK
jgi:hypothetical protein